MPRRTLFRIWSRQLGEADWRTFAVRRHLAMSTILVAIISLTGCALGKTYLVRDPTASAKLVQTWSLEDFILEIENHERELQKGSSGSDPALVLLPLFDIPFEAEDLNKLRSHAEKGDLVLWYSDHWLDLDIDYICLQRAGKIIWTHKTVKQRPETLANQPATDQSRAVPLRIWLQALGKERFYHASPRI